MKKIYFLSFLCLCLIASVYGQTRQYTMEEATLGIRGSLAPEHIEQLVWIPESNRFAQVKGRGSDAVYLSVEVPSLTVDTIVSLAHLNALLFGKDSLKRFPPVQWLDETAFCFRVGRQLFLGESQHRAWSFRSWHVLPDNATHITIDKKQRQIAYTLGNNLYLMDHDGKEHAITADKVTGIVNGQSVHRNEFGIENGIFFSPKGNRLAFYRMDETMVDGYPVIDWSVTPAKTIRIKYPMAGRTSHEVTLGVYNPVTGKTVFMDTGTPGDHYLTCVTWSPDERHIYIAILNRDQNHLWLNKYDAETGAFLQTLFEERDPKYVQPLHPLYFLPNNDQQFIWWSQRDGFMHLYRYRTDGKLLNQVTSGSWVVNDIEGLRAAGKELVIACAAQSPMARNIYAVNWENGKLRRLDKAEGTHIASVNNDGTYWIDRYSNATTPRNIRVASTRGKWETTLLHASDPLSEFERPRVEDVTLTAADGTPLYGRLIYPTDFDSLKHYPVIVYLYNGPNVQLLHHSFPSSGNLWYEYLAQHGYLVFTMDGRGSSNRGLEFEQATFRQLGTVEMEDQLRGVAYLKSLPYVDAQRLGVHGWSFGGFMTISLMLRHPGVFKCAVAGGPVIDWSMYEVMYTERYMDRPQDNPQGYRQASLLDKVQNLDGKLLVIHGAADSTVVLQHSMKFLKACVDHGVQVDYFVYPGHPHNVRGEDRVHLMQKVTDYFDTFLK